MFSMLVSKVDDITDWFSTSVKKSSGQWFKFLFFSRMCGWSNVRSMCHLRCFSLFLRNKINCFDVWVLGLTVGGCGVLVEAHVFVWEKELLGCLVISLDGLVKPT